MLVLLAQRMSLGIPAFRKSLVISIILTASTVFILMVNRPMLFFDDLFANASKNGVGIVIYSGNDDMLVAHRGSEITIQVCLPSLIYTLTDARVEHDLGRYPGILAAAFDALVYG